MALTQEQQAFELINRSKRVLVVTRHQATPDALSSLCAMAGYLKKMGKQHDAVAPDCETDKLPSFLPNARDIVPGVGSIRAFELRLDVSRVPLSELMYDVKDGKLDITVLPKSGEWSPKDVTFRHGEDRYDLIVAVDCPDQHSLGSLFRDHADFLYRVPIITVDRDPAHGHWGQLNLIDLTAVSTTEVLHGLFTRWNKDLLDEDIATSLLAGMIAKTQSFRTSNVTPKALQTASELVSLGARRQEIVHTLWRNKSVPTLKLWGRALSRIEQDEKVGLVWTMLSRQDFLAAGVGESSLDGIISELVSYSPEAKVVVLFYEKDGTDKTGAHVALHALNPYSAAELGRPFGASGSKERADFTLGPGVPLLEGAKKIIDRLRETMKAQK